MFEAQAWMKGKSKGKTKGHAKDGPGQRSVNAHASELFLGGLDVSEAMEITGTGVQTASPSVGMLDCGATASAAPKAIVRSLISAVSLMTRVPRLSLSNPRDRISGLGIGVGDELCAEYICVAICLDNHNTFHCMRFPTPIDAYYHNDLDRSCQFSSEWTSLGPPLRDYRQPTAPPHPGARAVGN